MGVLADPTRGRGRAAALKAEGCAANPESDATPEKGAGQALGASLACLVRR